jgi:hypothetical protein
MAISPMQFLALVIGFTAAARVIFVINRNRRRGTLQRLAREWRMHYSAHDRFDISNRLGERFPLPGAAEIKAIDVIYGTEGEHYRFIFIAEYTSGVVRSKHRLRRAVTFREPKGHSGSANWSKLILGDEALDLVDQYQALHRQIHATATNEKDLEREVETLPARDHSLP